MSLSECATVLSLTPAQCCQSASCESWSCLKGISRSICKYVPFLYDVDSLAHVSGRLLSALQSEPLHCIPLSIPISSLIAFLHNITCPRHGPYNSSPFPSSSLLSFLLCSSQISIYFVGWLTSEGSARDDSRDVSSLWCSVIVLTMCSHNSHQSRHTHTHTRYDLFAVLQDAIRENLFRKRLWCLQALLWGNFLHMSPRTHWDPQATPLWLFSSSGQRPEATKQVTSS